MSFAPNPYGQLSNEEFFQNPRLAMLRALQSQGINTDYNFLARRQLERANELIPLAYAYGGNQDEGVTQGNFLDFANQYARSQFQPGGGGQFSNQNIAARVRGLMNQGQGTDAYDWLREGDPEEQWQRFASLQALQQRGRLPGFAQAAQNVQQRAFENWWLQMAQNPGGGANGATNWLDAFLGRRSPSPAAQAAAFQTQPVAPPPMTPAAPGTTTANPPPFSMNQDVYGNPTNPGAPGFSNWQSVLDHLMRGHDPRNLSTEGMSGPGRAFSYGGVTYNPQADVGRQYRDMSSSGRVTNRGAAWNVFVYRLQQLMQQRNRGGNPSLGITGQTTDDQLARMAAEFVNQKNMGSTGFSFA